MITAAWVAATLFVIAHTYVQVDNMRARLFPEYRRRRGF
jgi:hypothetical protein